jgi:hypothetical protein
MEYLVIKEVMAQLLVREFSDNVKKALAQWLKSLELILM